MKLNINKAKFDEYPDLLNVTEMSLMLKISVKTTYKLLKNHSVKHLKIGREYRIPKIHVIDYLFKAE